MESVYESIIRDKKYSRISKDTISRIIKGLESKNIKRNELLKRVKEELYNIHFNYYKSFNYNEALRLLKKAYDSKEESLILNTHESLLKKYDNNRLISVKSGLYDEVFKITGKPKILLDLACGLNPLTLPWMKLDKGSKYYCYDIEKEQISFLNSYFKLFKSDYQALLLDVLSKPPVIKADATLLFKSTTCFEWQKPGNTLALIKSLNSKWIIFSLMLRGNENIKGSRNYFNNLFKGLQLEFSSELVFNKEYIRIIKINK